MTSAHIFETHGFKTLTILLMKITPCPAKLHVYSAMLDDDGFIFIVAKLLCREWSLTYLFDHYQLVLLVVVRVLWEPQRC